MRHHRRQPRPDRGGQLISLLELFLQLVLQRGKTFGKGRVVLLDRLGPHLATGGQHMAMTADLVNARGFAEARDICVTNT